jgi:predicted nucleotidyltransferase
MLLKNKGKTLLFSILKQGRRTKAEVQVYGSRVNGRVCFSDLDLVLRS